MKSLIEALECALHALENPDSDQDFAISAVKDALSARELNLDGIHLVYYDSDYEFATLDLAAAEAYRDAKMIEYSALPWKIGSVSDLGSKAYSNGCDEGYQQGYDEGAE